jgi:DNA-directed RNA polymerase beta subunit
MSAIDQVYSKFANILTNITYTANNAEDKENAEYGVDKYTNKKFIIKPADKCDVTFDNLRYIYGAFINHYGFVGFQLRAMNEFYYSGLKHIITNVFKINVTILGSDLAHNPDGKIEKIVVTVEFTDVSLSRPKCPNDNKPLFPTAAIRQGIDYEGLMTVNARATAELYRREKDGNNMKTIVEKKHSLPIKDWALCPIAVMVGSALCNTHGRSRQELLALNEDPDAIPGNFIIGGHEWNVVGTENIPYGEYRCFNNFHGGEHTRNTVISKFGDSQENSAQCIVRLMEDGKITVEISRSELQYIQIPFYIFAKIIGISTDRELVELILAKPFAVASTDADKFILTKLSVAFEASYGDFDDLRYEDDLSEILRTTALVWLNIMRKVKNGKNSFSKYDPNAKGGVGEKHILEIIDKLRSGINEYFFPIKGSTAESLFSKQYDFASMIAYELLVAKGDIPQTDRDSFVSKRAAIAAPSYAKILKTQFSLNISHNIKHDIELKYKKEDFNSIDLLQIVTAKVGVDKFRSAMQRCIKVGNRADLQISANKIVKNRLATSLEENKSTISTLLSKRQINANVGFVSKSSERAMDMRQVHNSGEGFICAISTPEGTPVGTHKQPTAGATVLLASKSQDQYINLLRQPGVYPIAKCTPEFIYEKKLSKIFINGGWFACCENAPKLEHDLLLERRMGKIDRNVTIVRNVCTNFIYIWCESGRLGRVVIPVYNNEKNPEFFDEKYNAENPMKTFVQGVMLNGRIIKGLEYGELSYDDLVEMGSIEIISPDEQTNYLICASWAQLVENSRNVLLPYTYLSIPFATLGINILGTPHGETSQTVRGSFAGNQRKQTCSRNNRNITYRMDHNSYFKLYNQRPIVTTEIDNYIPTGGENAFVVMMSDDGYNQEDSLDASGGAVGRGFLDTYKTVLYHIQLESREQFMIPNENNTVNVKLANYSFLDAKGFIRPGSIVEKDTVLVGKVILNEERQGAGMGKSAAGAAMKYADTSVIYRDKEPGIVHCIYSGRDLKENHEFCNILILKPRKLSIGDKGSSRSGQKATMGAKRVDSDMPFTRTGEIPQFIMNPHAIPTRMTVTDLLESYISEIMLVDGKFYDGTYFNPIDYDGLKKMRLERKMDLEGTYTLYEPNTGVRKARRVFGGHKFMQILQKFSNDAFQSNSIGGPTDPITRQPTQSSDGPSALRMGEMEKDVMCVNNAADELYSKFGPDSDGMLLPICKTCGKLAIANEEKSEYRCVKCEDLADIVLVPSTCAVKAIGQTINVLGFGLKHHIDPPHFQNIAD